MRSTVKASLRLSHGRDVFLAHDRQLCVVHHASELHALALLCGVKLARRRRERVRPGRLRGLRETALQLVVVGGRRSRHRMISADAFLKLSSNKNTTKGASSGQSSSGDQALESDRMTGL